MANAECCVCPGNSESTVSGLTVCPCVDGYYRAEGEEDRECTRKQLVHDDISVFLAAHAQVLPRHQET